MGRSVMDRFEKSGLFEPDILLASQVERRQHPSLQPEKRLMLAVLEDAIEVAQKYRSARDPRGKAMRQEALDWIMSRDRRWPFSAANVCDALGLNHGYICAGLTRPPTPPIAA